MMKTHSDFRVSIVQLKNQIYKQGIMMYRKTHNMIYKVTWEYKVATNTVNFKLCFYRMKACFILLCFTDVVVFTN